MKFLLDENFPRSAVRMLNEQGHEAIDIRDISTAGLNDEAIFLIAQKENAVILTTDNDFFHTIPNLFHEHAGIVVISLHQPNRKSILEKLAWLLTQCDTHAFKSKVYLLRDRTFIVFPKE